MYIFPSTPWSLDVEKFHSVTFSHLHWEHNKDVETLSNYGLDMTLGHLKFVSFRQGRFLREGTFQWCWCNDVYWYSMVVDHFSISKLRGWYRLTVFSPAIWFWCSFGGIRFSSYFIIVSFHIYFDRCIVIFTMSYLDQLTYQTKHVDMPPLIKN